MNRNTRYWTLVSSILIFTLLSLPANAALVKYTYTGNPFSYVQPETEDHTGLTIWFTVDEALLPKNGLAILKADNDTSAQIPFDFEFSFGYDHWPRIAFNPSDVTWDPQTDTLTLWNTHIEFNTDSDGHLSSYWLATASKGVFSSSSLIGNTSISSESTGLNTIDSVWSYPFEGSITNNPGTWTRTVVPVPLPGGLLLFVSALSGLCLNMRLTKRRR
ncbi:MAG: hypothetical protein Q8Q40_10420 [Methylococcaceae bacterium]|nr:hypothetical protein [Methylococcaceae bacterium]MDP3904374.1 hypothetical protein [Methylococcaceae bacterium]